MTLICSESREEVEERKHKVFIVSDCKMVWRRLGQRILKYE